jgi:hypothetical protein
MLNEPESAGQKPTCYQLVPIYPEEEPEVPDIVGFTATPVVCMATGKWISSYGGDSIDELVSVEAVEKLRGGTLRDEPGSGQWIDRMVSACPAGNRLSFAESLLRAAQPDAAPEERGWMLYYSDQDQAPEIFCGVGAEAAARGRFETQRSAWTCFLFQEVARG